MIYETKYVDPASKKHHKYNDYKIKYFLDTEIQQNFEGVGGAVSRHL